MVEVGQETGANRAMFNKRWFFRRSSLTWLAVCFVVLGLRATTPTFAQSQRKVPTKSKSTASKPRTWTSQSGRTTKAKFIRVHNQRVVLQRGKRVFKIPIQTLCDRDQNHIQSLLAAADHAKLANTVDEATTTKPSTAKYYFRNPLSRTWSDNFGNTSNAEMIGIRDSSVVFKKGARRFQIPLWRLHRENRMQVKLALDDVNASRFFPGRLDETEPVASQEWSTTEWRKLITTWTRIAEGKQTEALTDNHQALANLHSITDTAAVAPLLTIALRSKRADVRIATVAALARMDSEPAMHALSKRSMLESDERVRNAAILAIAASENRDTVLEGIAPFVKGKFRDGAINLLAYSGLLESQDIYQSPNAYLTRALIDALFAKRTEQAAVWRGFDTGWQGWRDIFGNSNARRRLSGRTQRMPVKVAYEQPFVKQTLVQHTGEDFGFDQAKWREWSQEMFGSANRNP